MLEKFKSILKREQLRSKDFCKRVGLSYASYRTMTRTHAESTPKWVKSFLLGYELGKKSKSDENGN